MKQQYIKELIKQGNSNYVLVPKNVIQALVLNEKDKVIITIEKLGGKKMYIAIRQKGTDIILDQATFSTQDYADFETLDEALDEMNSDIDDFMFYVSKTYENYYAQQID